MKRINLFLVLILLMSVFGCTETKQKDEELKQSPRIINIINFIRQTDYRVENADEKLLEAVKNHIELAKLYSFPTTFLFQYDALINPKYQQLMKTELPKSSELGAWWEITQPHVEAAGLKWRGEHSWVSTANIAFTTGYTTKEREKLVDVYFAKFKEIYGYYPKSVGSWYIDAYTINYMYKKYGIVASCNCKDQVGTDGYTLWGGYWNQAYYPSKVNGYMPAQTVEGQIPVPIFRMLGSDPIYQLDTGIGHDRQGVISLEPVYPESGMNKDWVEYFMDSHANQACLAFSYAQAGQENSFTWDGMQKGLEMQYPIFKKLSNEGKIKIQTLGESGKWFRDNFETTPPTAITALKDVRKENRKTVWYNSKYYRINLLWEGEDFRIRDIHLFDEKLKSNYLDEKGEGHQFIFYTLPIVDPFFWSKTEQDRACIKLKQLNNEVWTDINFKSQKVEEISETSLKVTCETNEKEKFVLTLNEDNIDISYIGTRQPKDWILQLYVPKVDVQLPFKDIKDKEIDAEFKNYAYKVKCNKGKFTTRYNDDNVVFSVEPESDKIIINCN